MGCTTCSKCERLVDHDAEDNFDFELEICERCFMQKELDREIERCRDEG